MRSKMVTLAVLAVGTCGFLIYHWTQLSTRLEIMPGNRGDSRFILFLCEHWFQALQGRAELFSPPMFYPLSGTLARSDLVAGYGVPYAFFRGLGLDSFVALQVTSMSFTLLAYLGAFALLRWGLRAGPGWSSLGAAFFAFNSPRFMQLHHLQLQSAGLSALVFLGLAVVARSSPSQVQAAALLSLAGGALVLQLLTSFYLGWFCMLWLGLWLGMAWLLPVTREQLLGLLRRYPAPLGLAAFLTLAGLLGTAVIYLPVARAEPSFAGLYLPDWSSTLVLGDRNWFWGRATGWLLPEPRPPGWGEGLTGLGLVFSLAWLSLSGYCLARAGPLVRDPKAAWLLLGVAITNLLYLLPHSYFGYSPWHLVYGLVPGAGAIRAPGRVMLFLALPLAVGLVWGFSRLWARLGRRGRLALGLVLAAGFGEQVGRGDGYPASRERAYLQAMAARVPAECEAFYVTVPPADSHPPYELQIDAILVAQLSGRPTCNGYTGLTPRDWQLGEPRAPEYPHDANRWAIAHGRRPFFRLELWPAVESFQR